jgi:NADPH:quinone reductase-like Zn-dependent oxidoreductase
VATRARIGSLWGVGGKQAKAKAATSADRKRITTTPPAVNPAFVVKENAGELLALNELVAAGKIKPVMGPTFPLAAGADAVAAFEAGGIDGRMTITP